MKKTILLALALVAGASLYTADAAKKKTKTAEQPAAETVQPVVLTSTSDSVSYAAGMSLTNGLVPFLLQQNVDTTMMADFVRGFQEAVKADNDPKMKA